MTHVVVGVVVESCILTQDSTWAQHLLKAAEVQYLFLFQSILPPFWHKVREQSQCFFSLLSEEKRALAVLQGLNIRI